MLRYRLIFGPIMIAALLGLLYLDNHIDRLNIDGTWLQPLFLGRIDLPAGLLMLGMFIVAISFTAIELCAIFRAKGIEASAVMVVLAGIVGCVLIYILPHRLDAQTTIAIYASMLVLLFVAALFNHSFFQKRTQGAIAAAGVVMFSMMYCGILPGFFLAIRRWHTAWVILGIILITKSCDIGAYFTGRALGRHKLIPWLSPGKTWEGLIGGVLLATIMAVALTWLGNRWELTGHNVRIDGALIRIPREIPLWLAALAGALFGVVGQFGDLTASLLKRDAGIKDSGRAIPGFGGVLDVVDSPVLVAPVAYWMLRLADQLSR
jgi:phosphatidate cytidylyltransferase